MRTLRRQGDFVSQANKCLLVTRLVEAAGATGARLPSREAHRIEAWKARVERERAALSECALPVHRQVGWARPPKAPGGATGVALPGVAVGQTCRRSNVPEPSCLPLEYWRRKSPSA
ncbi:hypothetical protein GCM10010341_79640 [Streptomyces noursei]|nr:hypothetical protein GCM10010341_79640 [Streptomyces noursei]